MAKKKLTKILWYGSEKDANGNPIVPAIAPSVEKHLEGLNEGEIYVHNDDANPCLFIRTNADKVAAIGGADALSKHFLRKDKEDTAKEKITFEKGVEVGSDKEGKGIIYDKETKKATAIIDELKKLLLLQSDDFLQGELGSGFVLKYDKEKKRSYLEIDEILVRKIAYFVSLVIKDLKHVGGSLILSPASMTCSKVEVYDTYYRCYFEQNDGEKTINQEFVAGDLARSQTFNIKEGTSDNVSNTYYWRYVVNVGDNFIDLSITDCDSGSGIPKKGDEIVQLGNRYDEGRQNAIILSTVGDDAPSIKQYKGIKYYFLSDDNAVTIFSPSGNVIKGNFISASTGKNLDEELKKLQVDWDSVLDQTDKEFTMWFYPYAPALDNLPASEWTSEELRELHDQDLFFDNSTGGETSGKAYRFEKNEEGNWVWSIVNDAETIKALENAAFANKRLDNIVADNILSSLEKKEVLKEWNSLHASFTENINAASDFSLTVEDSYLSGYINAYNALATYMNGGVSLSGSTPSWLADLSTNQKIDGDEYRSKWTNYYKAESELLNHLSVLAKEKADNAKDAADDAQETADNAKTQAEEAKNSITEIVSDGILSSLEKKEVLREWEEISSAYSLNLSNASENDVDTSSYTSVYKALGTYLNNGSEWNGGIPSWLADLSSNQSIDSAIYRAKWVDYYDAEVALLESISSAIKKKAEGAQTAADNAQQAADNAQTEAESKKRVFVSQPTIDSRYDVGDLWVNAIYKEGAIEYSNEEMVCITAKAKGEAFSIDHWRPSNGYNESMLVLSDTMSKLAIRVDGAEAYLALTVTKDADGYISNAKLKADNISLEGYTSINSGFNVLADGTVLCIDMKCFNGTFSSINIKGESSFEGTINATDGVFNGEVNATSGTFNNVTFQTGKLAGFNVSANSIISDLGAYSGGSDLNSFTDSRFFLYASGPTSANMGYSSTYRRSTIGLNTMPNTTGSAALGMFTDTQTPENYQDKIGLYISIQGGLVYDNGYQRNSALYIEKGHIAGYRRRLRRTNMSATLNAFDGVVVCTHTSGSITITLPSAPEDGQEYWMISANQKEVNVAVGSSSHTITQSGSSFSTDRWHVYIFDAYNEMWLYSYMNY